MISVLIPVFNYNIVPLVKALHQQLIEAKIPFEIVAYENGSETHFLDKNDIINHLTFTNYSVLKHNSGREQTRQLLSNKAKYPWLLFLDADTLPAPSDFIKSYLLYVNSDYAAVFGGILYQQQSPEKDYMLRWKYGRARETINAAARNKHPYRSVVSANFMIKKSVFVNLNERITGKEYGNDIFFAALLKSHSSRILHIDNQVYHLGIEKSDTYLSKNEEAIKTYLSLARNGSISYEDNRLLTSYTTLKRYKLNYPMSVFYKFFKLPLTYHLLSANPNITLLQLYRLAFMCSIDLKTSD